MQKRGIIGAVITLFILVFGGWLWRRYEESGHIDLREGCIRPQIDSNKRYGKWLEVETQDEDIFSAGEGAAVVQR